MREERIWKTRKYVENGWKERRRCIVVDKIRGEEERSREMRRRHRSDVEYEIQYSK